MVRLFVSDFGFRHSDFTNGVSMSTVSLQDILGGPNLVGVIQGTATGVPNVFPPAFYQVDKTVDRDTGQYTRVKGTRTLARIAAYGSPSQQRNLTGAEAVPVKLIHTVESIMLPTADYLNLLQLDDTAAQTRGIQEVTRQVRAFRQNFDNLRVAALTQMLFQGAIYWDGHGNLLPNATNAQTIANFAVPAGNMNQLNVLGAGNLLDTAWNNAAADVDQQLLNLRQAAARLSGYPLKYAFYGKNIPGYLTANTKLANYFIRGGGGTGDATQYLSTADIPSPLLGLTWLPAFDAFFEDFTGTNQGLVGDDQIVFTPDPSPGLDRLARRHLPHPHQPRRRNYRRRPTVAEQRHHRRRHVRLRHAVDRPRNGQNGGGGHVPAGAEGAGGDLYRHGEVLVEPPSELARGRPNLVFGRLSFLVRNAGVLRIRCRRAEAWP